MRSEERVDRRAIVTAAGVAGLHAILTGPTVSGASAAAREDREEEEHPVTPAEDLMFEHGVLERLLLIYAETMRRIESGAPGAAEPLGRAAGLFRRFGEDYHERLEEQHIFPILETKDQYSPLARELKRQHEAGRRVTTSLLDMTKSGSLAQPERAAQALRSFYRMYLPHISRENSVAFRAFQTLVPPARYRDLGEQFEEKEHSLFGQDGFHQIVEQVTAIEKTLGIHDIAQFTAGGPAS